MCYTHSCFSGWLESVGFRVLYELDYKKPILYVVPVESILGKLPVVPVVDTWTIQHTIAIFFLARSEIAWRVQGTDAGCGLSIRGLWAGPAKCNEGLWGWRRMARWSATYSLYYINYVDYISYFNWNELICIIDIIWHNDIKW